MLMMNWPASVRGNSSVPISGAHRQACNEQRGDRSDDQQLVIQRAREHPFVSQGEALVDPDERREYAVPGAFLLCARLFRGQKPRAVDRNHAHRDQVRSNHRQHHRQRQRAEQVLRDAEQEHHRKEHDDGRDGRGQHRERDLLGAVFGRLRRRLTQPRWRLMFSSTTTESSTRRPIASANPPSVMMLIVLPLM